MAEQRSWSSCPKMVKLFSVWEEQIARNVPGYQFHADNSDVIVAGPVKCGTTWLQSILHHIKHRGDADMENIWKVCPELPWPFEIPAYDLNYDQILPRVFKTHMTLEYLKEVIDKPLSHHHIIIISRNPVDSFKSVKRFFYRFWGTDMDIPDEELIKLLRDPIGKVRFGYHDFIASWWSHKDRENILWLSYEDLKANTRQTIAKIAHFMNIDLSQKDVETVLRYCDYGYMSKYPEKYAVVPQKLDADDKVTTTKSQGFSVVNHQKHEVDLSREVLDYLETQWHNLNQQHSTIRSYTDLITQS